MAVRGVYTKEEAEMLADFNKRADALIGWLGEEPKVWLTYPVLHRDATKELISNFACASDYWNPLWRDENYAKGTRWGGIIAPPLFENCITHGGGFHWLDIPVNVGYGQYIWFGENFQFFNPIHVNDSFKVWFSRLKIEDVTSLDEKGPRKFNMVAELRYVNQRDEVTSIRKQITKVTIASQPKKEIDIATDYRYTKEELEFIERTANEEEIRGASIRYWEDVNVDDEPKAVVYGPSTAWDQVITMAGIGVTVLPTREVVKKTPDATVLDPITGVTHKTIELHLVDRVAQLLGSSKCRIMAVASMQVLCRLITNWMGDDGFLKRFEWRRRHHANVGDTIFGRGKVIKKYVENGDHLVDLAVWSDSIRGNITDTAIATVSLHAKEDL